jgi:hypothetical protein
VQHLGERAHRPPASGQLAIEEVVPCGQHEARGAFELPCPPHPRNLTLTPALSQGRGRKACSPLPWERGWG